MEKLRRTVTSNNDGVIFVVAVAQSLNPSPVLGKVWSQTRTSEFGLSVLCAMTTWSHKLPKKDLCLLIPTCTSEMANTRMGVEGA